MLSNLLSWFLFGQTLVKRKGIKIRPRMTKTILRQPKTPHRHHRLKQRNLKSAYAVRGAYSAIVCPVSCHAPCFVMLGSLQANCREKERNQNKTPNDKNQTALSSKHLKGNIDRRGEISGHHMLLMCNAPRKNANTY